MTSFKVLESITQSQLIGYEHGKPPPHQRMQGAAAACFTWCDKPQPREHWLGFENLISEYKHIYR
jgi:hypothetical protein